MAIHAFSNFTHLFQLIVSTTVLAYAPSESLLPTTTEEIPLLSPNVVAVLKEEARKLEILTATIKLMIDMRYIDTIKGYLYRKSQNLLKATRLQIAMVAQNQN